MSTISSELQALAPSAKLVFYVIDATAQGAGVMRFHNGTNELSQAVVWQGQTYQHAPVEASGFDVRGDGPRPRPTIGVGDVYGVLGALVRQHKALRGAKLLRKRTHARYLDAENFLAGNPEADANAEYDDELWIFDRIKSRDGTAVVWELVSPMDLEDVLLPARQVRNTVCTWGYRTGEGCDYAGPPVAKADDTPTSNLAEDVCSLRVSGCKLRYGATAWLPIGIFPGAGRLRQI